MPPLGADMNVLVSFLKHVVLPVACAVTVFLFLWGIWLFNAPNEHNLYVRCGETEFDNVYLVEPVDGGLQMTLRSETGWRYLYYTGEALCEWGEAPVKSGFNNVEPRPCAGSAAVKLILLLGVVAAFYLLLCFGDWLDQ